MHYPVIFCLLLLKHANSDPHPLISSLPLEKIPDSNDIQTSNISTTTTQTPPRIPETTTNSPIIEQQLEKATQYNNTQYNDTQDSYIPIQSNMPLANNSHEYIDIPQPITSKPTTTPIPPQIPKLEPVADIHQIEPLPITPEIARDNNTNYKLVPSEQEIEWIDKIMGRNDRSLSLDKKEKDAIEDAETTTQKSATEDDDEVSTTTMTSNSADDKDDDESDAVTEKVQEITDEKPDEESGNAHDGNSNDVNEDTEPVEDHKVAEDNANKVSYQDVNEISHPVIRKLCIQLKEKYKSKLGRTGRSYLWAPIYQYAPALEAGFPLAAPEFTPECMKWKLKSCNGTDRFPLMTPCTFWAPMALTSSYCFSPEVLDDPSSMSIFVNYRPPEYNETYCPCRWPCTPHFDKIQHCRVNRTEAMQKTSVGTIQTLNSEENQSHPIHIPHYQAMQLCRGMHGFLESSTPVKVDSIPIRIVSLTKEGDPIKDCISWRYSPCKVSGDKDGEENEKQQGGKAEVEVVEPSEPVENATETTTTPPNLGETERRRRRKRDDSSAVETTNELPSVAPPACGVWEEVETEVPGCKPDTLAPKNDNSKNKVPPSESSDDTTTSTPLEDGDNTLSQKDSTCPGGKSCSVKQKSKTSSKDHFSTYAKEPGCNCDWPCLPFFDPINKCYNDKGILLLDANGKPIILPRKLNRSQKQLVLCLSYLDKDEIDCFIKK